MTDNRVDRALQLHWADASGLCATCKTASPCETRQALTGQPAQPFLVTRTDPVQEVVCSPDAIAYMREHFQVAEEPTSVFPRLASYMGLPVFVDDALPPRTVRLQPSSPKQ